MWLMSLIQLAVWILSLQDPYSVHYMWLSNVVIKLTNVTRYSLEPCEVHKYAAIPGLHGAMGWVSISVDISVSMVRFCNSLIKIDVSRLSKIFLWDYHSCKNNFVFSYKNTIR